MYIVTSFSCFTTQNCISWTLSPLFIFHYKQSCTSCILFFSIFMFHYRTVLHAHCHFFFMFHYTQLYFMYIDTFFLCFTAQSCISCTLSPLFYISINTAVLHVHCRLFFHISLHTELYFMYIVISFLYFTTNSCISCILSPVFLCFTTHSCPPCTLSHLFYVSLHTAVLHAYYPLFFYVSLHTAVLHVHCHIFFTFHNTHQYFMYIVTSFVCFTTHSCISCTLTHHFHI